MRSPTRTCLSGIAAFAMLLLLLGCCGNNDTAAARTRAPEPPPEPVVVAAASAPQPEVYSERAGIKVSMFPLSSPPAPPPPPPRMTFAEAPPAYYPPPAYNPAPVAGVCQIVPPGATLISDPPTITLSSSGEVVDRTGTVFYPVNAPVAPAPAYATSPVYAPPSATTITLASAPVETSVYAPTPYTTVYDSTSSYTALEPIQPGSATYIPTTTTVSETRTVSYTQPAVTTTTVYEPSAPPLNTVSAVYYPDAPPLTTAPFPGAPVGPALAGGPLRLVPALDIPPGNHPNDALPSQWFEIIRPGNGPIRIGRVSSTCVCVSPRVPNRHVAAGERALIEARIVKRPPANNLTYGLFVNTVEPTQLTLDSDITIGW